MSIRAADAIKRKAALSTEIAELRRRKCEIGNLIHTRKAERDNLEIDMSESVLIPAADVSESEANAVPAHTAACFKVLRVKIRKRAVVESEGATMPAWRIMMPPFDRDDGEYYLFMNDVDYFCYTVFVAGGNPDDHENIMWREDYGKRDCMSADCWYEGNLDRRKEFKCNYVITESGLTDRISICDVDYENDGGENGYDYFQQLRAIYNKRADPKQRHNCEVCRQSYCDDYLNKCEECAAPNYVCNFCYDDVLHDCHICAKYGCSKCLLKRRDDDFVVHSDCIMPQERGDYE